MVKNMSTIDRTLRVVVALVILVLVLTSQITGTLAVILSIVGMLFLVTSFLGTCFLYIPFKFSTKKK